MRYIATVVTAGGSVQYPEVRADSEALAMLGLSQLGLYVELLSIWPIRESSRGTW